MTPPLQDGQVKYQDGSPATVQQYSRDVTAFLMWAADPKLEERKSLGWKVMLYLLATTLLLYVAKKRLWASVH
jgi:cytochrome c1